MSTQPRTQPRTHVRAQGNELALESQKNEASASSKDSRSQDLGDEISPRELEAIFQAARGEMVVVLGDLMLDEWILGTTSRISPEAPVPIVRLSERRTAPGGAANVAMNLVRLGARVAICGVVGADEAGVDLARELGEAGIDTRGLVRDEERPTTLKTRIVAQQQQMLRVDRESDLPLPVAVREQLQARLQELLSDARALCVSDYDKGLATGDVFSVAVEAAQKQGLFVTGGPKPLNLGCCRGADFLSLNQKEASEAASIKLDSLEAVECAGEALLGQIGARALAITRGARGVALFQKGEPPCHLKAHAVEVFDVAGAGDTFLAAATIALVGGASFVQASETGNLAAAASVRHSGVVAITPQEVARVAQGS